VSQRRVFHDPTVTHMFILDTRAPMASQERSGFLPVSDGRLYYETSGKGPAIVFIHAAIADRRMWNREFAIYAKDRTVVRYDVRGFGRSPPASTEYSDVDDLRRLLAHIGARTATLVGCSNGGRIALDFAVENPDQVAGLLLVSPGVSGFTAELAPEGKPVFEQDNVRSAKIPGAWKAGRKQEAIEALREYWTAAQEGANLELVRTMMKENAEEIFTDSSASHNRVPDPPAVGRLGSISAPTAVLLGDRDEPSMTFIVRTVVRGIPRAKLVPVPGADHLVNLSRPADFDKALRQLLESVR
jgi:3-oxoadipate enol-lactonase